MDWLKKEVAYGSLSDAADAADDKDASTSPAPSRWWILTVFSVFAFVQGGVWAIPGPISQRYQDIYQVDGNTIQMLINWGPIFYIPFAVPCAWYLDRPDGLRRSTFLGIVLVVMGSGLRCLATTTSTLRW